jgi:A predicted alpha-helical domain with a conserved ER motif.
METIYKTKANHSISTAKATQLYWLGRYAERVYSALHQLRKHYDLMIDEDETAYLSFCDKMGIANRYHSSQDFMHSFLYDSTNPDSVINMLEHANDNAILLREVITSETLSYIQISISYMKNVELKSQNIHELQQITDYILAFWGSIDERIFSTQIRQTIKFGKWLESMDLHLRFNYPFNRIEQIYTRLLDTIEKDDYICDEIALLQMKGQITFDNYKEAQTLIVLNSLFSPKI